jgi:hypothetical protein
MVRVIALLSLVLAVLLAACGGNGGGGATRDPVANVPSENGIRESVQAAATPTATEFPPAEGRTLDELSKEVAPGPSLALASSVFTSPGENRMAFGVIAEDGTPVYGPTAVYVAPEPGAPAEGPFVAPADVLMTEARYRSKQAATTDDPFVAVYGADVKFAEKGKYSVLSVTKRTEGGFVGATGEIDVSSKDASPVPAVGEKAPKIHTDTLESAGGDVSKIDTRLPPSDMHTDFADVVGSEPVALLFSTPQLCASRVCGPVTDIALQLQAKYGDQMTFIHQEVYVDNDVNKGLREPLKQFSLPSEPWLFVVDSSGTITARLEGSIGVAAFEDAVKSGL